MLSGTQSTCRSTEQKVTWERFGNLKSGPGAPAAALGVKGDFYYDTAAHALYGPKGVAWGSPILLGVPGDAGRDGNTILSGAGAPGPDMGVDGDFWVDISAMVMWGPKAGGTWPMAGTSLTGPPGEKGEKGEKGEPGSLTALGDLDGLACAVGDVPGTIATAVADNGAVTITCVRFPRDLTVEVPVNGRVMAGPDLDCPTTCTATFAYGASVDVVAVPDPGWTLDAWGGACAGTTGYVCTLTMDAARTVSVTYKPGVVLALAAHNHCDLMSTPGGTAWLCLSVTLTLTPGATEPSTQFSTLPEVAPDPRWLEVPPVTGSWLYAPGTTVTIEITGGTMYGAPTWTGCTTFTDTSCTVILDTNVDVDLQL